MAETTATKEIHDLLLANMPEGASHPEDCVLCAMQETTPAPTGEPGGAMAKTYTEEEVRAAAAHAADEAVATRTSELQAELDALKDEKMTSESEAALAELRESFESEKSELQSKLDEKTLEAETAKKERDDIISWLDGEKTAADEQAAIEARREQRLEAAKAAAEFPEGFTKYLEENADRIAAMSDDEFDARVAEWAALAGGKTPSGGGKEDELPSSTALHASREGRESGRKTSAVKELFAMRREGIDPRTL